MGEIRVAEVKRKDGRAVSVSIDVEGIIFCFYRKRGSRISFTKSKLDAQVYDENELWVPDELFTKACRQAAAILYPPGSSVAKCNNLPPKKPALSPRNGWRKKEKVVSQTFRLPACRRENPVNHTLPLSF